MHKVVISGLDGQGDEKEVAITADKSNGTVTFEDLDITLDVSDLLDAIDYLKKVGLT